MAIIDLGDKKNSYHRNRIVGQIYPGQFDWFSLTDGNTISL
ncbi:MULTISPECIES: hypothetical protein [Okeania]|nr:MULTISPECIES: hypothetical protein [Okeania]